MIRDLKIEFTPEIHESLQSMYKADSDPALMEKLRQMGKNQTC